MVIGRCDAFQWLVGLAGGGRQLSQGSRDRRNHSPLNPPLTLPARKNLKRKKGKGNRRSLAHGSGRRWVGLIEFALSLVIEYEYLEQYTDYA